MLVLLSFSVVNSLRSRIHIYKKRIHILPLMSFMSPSSLLGTFSWPFNNFHTYIITIAIAGFCCHFRIADFCCQFIILLITPSWEIIEEYTQTSDGDQYQLLLIKQK